MIVGFDHDDPSIFKVMPHFLAETRISAAIISMLHAIPTTPLFDRLKLEGRLNDEDGSNRYGTNVVPLGMSREELRDGFVQVMQACYSADAYFQRLDSQFFDESFKFAVHHLVYWKSHRWAWTKRCFYNYCKFVVVAFRLLRGVGDKNLRSRYRRQLFRVFSARWREPHILFIYAIKVAMHYHYAALTRALAQVETGSPNAGRSFSRVRRRSEIASSAAA
jgi:hypothetical protein